MEESIDFLAGVKDVFDCAGQDIRTYSPLTLAYIGDAVYELVIRSVVVERANRSNNELHKISVEYVKAESQSKMIQLLADCLTEKEQEIYRRGRNTKSNSAAKNASLADYKRATGFEALMGYLYLTGQNGRMFFLIREGIALAGLKI